MGALSYSQFDDTIVALATPQGIGAIAVVRLSGPQAISIANAVFHGKDLDAVDSHTIHFGTIREGKEVIDEVLMSVFIAPRSFTKENVVEISCHGSSYIIKRIINLLVSKGARLAKPGEFTKRAFLNGQFDLAQAEAVADVISSDSEAAHQAAMSQMRGGFSKDIKQLREQLIHFASMIELELDFGEEDVEFADRHDLAKLVNDLKTIINQLIKSFDLGNVIKNGVPTVIAGKPNAGKSTLLNALLKEEKAIVSDIAGTTRDSIEDEINIEGVAFRFIDTAGIRETTDVIEALGVERTHSKMKEASLILYLFDLVNDNITDINKEINKLENLGKPFIPIGNKIDKAPAALVAQLKEDDRFIFISASQQQYLEELKDKILDQVNLKNIRSSDTIVTNARHFESLLKTSQALDDVLTGIGSNVTGDFLALDIRQALHHLGEITGEVTNDDLLANIFSKFCIGK
ncbi:MULTISPECIES: tRNA uridine-5-carboxymethylaminomethyl(34) synthesis GTPase MnmE [unclassified Imperialibacter]|uniref:tRNA uridine-5-carboxymethylaminomethyl(34) synthesis GTPase MnmE n=1 Tax=unclassified Imperialibacter TaxID=2629706 RepID=UPI001259DDD5|nr:MULTISPECIES: tRNA uridine-5-carboxymethylaminomethyl(34) synthesis GTPase MnmE [unclassified Imperialibacter]CAD5258128.1 tRNA modification GTPase MnmE [Imperialibacter sp. 75]CAD5261188.1 tRNA modification GTPase MnmE [Imperialibacter sp. 89]VVT24992.1 tRNA modification GTPase MnmE [Imperialibacter sp. EC-SDR9]